VSESTLLKLRDGKNEREVLIKAWDDDNRTGDLIHVDFYEVEAGKTLHTRIPVRVTGDSPGEREGGVLQTTLHEIEIECLPKDIPDGVTVDVGELQIGDAIHLSDIPAPEGVTVLTSEDQVVVQVTWVREEPEEVEEEELEGEEGELAEEGAEGEEGEEESSEESEGE
jgi:large subunit ribosomal protein L25